MHDTGGDRYAAPMRMGTWPVALMGCAALFALYAGFRLFWFMTDDAYIAFRYVSNAMLGRGLVWNPAPFVPVEGYTSFLWTILLWGVWSVTGIEPPDAANWLSLACGAVTLTSVAHLVLTMRLPVPAARLRPYALAFVLLGTLTNRTYLAWLSSGLETALCNMLITLWILSVFSAARKRVLPFVPVLLASLIALARPDGLLYVAATLAMLGIAPLLGEEKLAWRSVWPVSIVAAHFAFRLSTYHELLPNTYYAKHAGAWPESGLRYLAAFALEYGLWIWLLVLLASLRFFVRALRAEGARPFLVRELPLLTVVCTLVAQAGYYTLIIGGDHFEFRVYSQLVPLLYVSFAWLCAWLPVPRAVFYVLCVAQLALGLPIPWLHWAKTRELSTRDETHFLRVHVGDDLPFVIAPLGHAWDALEDWLIEHRVGKRHQEHKVLCETQLALFPPREENLRVSWDERVVIAEYAVGVVGWRVPNFAVLDLFGLNDRVIAHQPLSPGTERMMAHDRHPPPGYIECFLPPRKDPAKRGPLPPPRRVDDATIRRCEARFAPP